MKLEECKHLQKCDFLGCMNLAKYSFSTRGIVRRELSFCEECMLGMAKCINQVLVPKSPKSPFKSIKKEIFNEKK